jgi:Fe-S-cluster-containing hydrogenase component 2
MNLRELFSYLTKDTKKDQVPKVLVVKKSRCPQNHRCPSVAACPTGALSQKGFAAPVINEKRCTSCGKCTRYCFPRALVLQKQ